MLDIDLFPSPLQLEAAAAWYMHAFVAVVLSVAAMIALLGQASALVSTRSAGVCIQS